MKKCSHDPFSNDHADLFCSGDRISFEEGGKRVEGTVKEVVVGDRKREPGTIRVTLDGSSKLCEVDETNSTIWCAYG